MTDTHLIEVKNLSQQKSATTITTTATTATTMTMTTTTITITTTKNKMRDTAKVIGLRAKWSLTLKTQSCHLC